MAYLAVSLQQLIFLLYLPVKHTTVLCNDNGTITRIISYELSHLAQQLACRLCSLAVVTLQLKQYQQ